jgi:hypothetical protein
VKGFRYAAFLASFESIVHHHSYLIQLEDYNGFLEEVREIYSNENQCEVMLPAMFKSSGFSLNNESIYGTTECRSDYELTSLPDGITPYFASGMDLRSSDFSGCRLSVPNAAITKITQKSYRSFLYTTTKGELFYIRYHEAEAQIAVRGEVLIHNGKEYRAEPSKEQTPCVFVRCAELVGADIAVSRTELEAATLYKPGMLKANHPQYFQ